MERFFVYSFEGFYDLYDFSNYTAHFKPQVWLASWPLPQIVTWQVTSATSKKVCRNKLSRHVHLCLMSLTESESVQRAAATAVRHRLSLSVCFCVCLSVCMSACGCLVALAGCCHLAHWSHRLSVSLSVFIWSRCWRRHSRSRMTSHTWHTWHGHMAQSQSQFVVSATLNDDVDVSLADDVREYHVM